MLVPKDGAPLNILVNHGHLTTEEMHMHAVTYAFANNCTTQDAANLFNCLKVSLTEEAQKKLLPKNTKYFIPVPDGAPAGAQPFANGLLFLKMIIDHSSVVTNASIAVITARLMDLDDKMIKLSSNITDFNTYIDE